MPPNDVQMFYRLVEYVDGESTTSQDLYDAYKLWAKSKDKRELTHSQFSLEFARLGHKTVKVNRRQRYANLKLPPDLLALLDESRGEDRVRKSQQAQDAAREQPRHSVDEAAANAGKLRAAAGEMRDALEKSDAVADKAVKAA
jgi:hypothetical protein